MEVNGRKKEDSKGELSMTINEFRKKLQRVCDV